MIDLDDLLAALIVEDQNKVPDALETLGRSTGRIIGLVTHQPFLPSDAAATLLQSIHQSQPRSQPIPTSADIAISPALQKTLAVANDLKESLQSKEITPLHLLAAVLAGSHKGVHVLRDAGITEEKVLDALRREDQ